MSGTQRVRNEDLPDLLTHLTDELFPNTNTFDLDPSNLHISPEDIHIRPNYTARSRKRKLSRVVSASNTEEDEIESIFQSTIPCKNNFNPC